MKKQRLDSLLFEKGYFDSRNKAQQAILSGNVYINNVQEDKPGRPFHEGQVRSVVIREKEKYVSRGGYKLEKAIHGFSLSVKGKVCMDVGCSTGGFTDCLLKHGAEKVYAIDVGYGQFDFTLRKDPRVLLFEKQNIRYLDHSLIREKINIITIDVSFISVTKFLKDLLPLCAEDFNIIILIKPQFESEKNEVKKGVIRSREKHIRIVSKLCTFFKKNDFFIRDFTVSPLKGPKGNMEFLIHLKGSGPDLDDKKIIEEIIQAVDLSR